MKKVKCILKGLFCMISWFQQALFVYVWRTWKLGCSLFITFAKWFGLNFMAIQSWSWFTELGWNLPEKVVRGIEKRSPWSEIFSVKWWNNNLFLSFTFFFFFSPSIFIIYRIIQYFHILIPNFHLEICVLSINLGVKMIEFRFIPQLFSDGAFLHEGRQIPKL